jgi:hypothetical protein
MAKTPKKSRQDGGAPSEDEVLRRMLNTPPQPHKPKGDKKKPKKDAASLGEVDYYVPLSSGRLIPVVKGRLLFHEEVRQSDGSVSIPRPVTVDGSLRRP